ncbi:MAG: teichoic acid biosynthesis protein B [Ruminococcaceae bacterium]|nr:teichoic acid biosynthesis protein B [Oscillospiraceae bacterium]
MKTYIKKVLKVLSLIKLSDIWDAVKIIASCPLGLILKLFKKNLWIVSEMEHTARDNGYWFFKYMRENYPDREVYYPIQFNSPDYEKVAKLGNVIRHGSFKHHIYTWCAKADISSRTGRGLPAPFMSRLFQVRGFYPFKSVFLQHGVNMSAAPFLERKRNRIDLFITSTEAEAKGLVDDLGYSEKQIKVIGLTRYDQLNEFTVTQNQILLMPTWRWWLYPDLGRITEADRLAVKNSTYVKTYREFLGNEKLNAFLKGMGLKLLFFPHNQMQPFIEEFKGNDNIVIASTENYDVQTALKESAYLITDYSSISFDFAYMKKPMCYFQFDYAEFREKHYQEGYFSYKNDGFGRIVKTVDSLVDEIISAYNNGFNMLDEYKQRVDTTFKYRDNNNSKRTFEAIENLLKR